MNVLTVEKGDQEVDQAELDVNVFSDTLIQNVLEALGELYIETEFKEGVHYFKFYKLEFMVDAYDKLLQLGYVVKGYYLGWPGKECGIYENGAFKMYNIGDPEIPADFWTHFKLDTP